MAATIEAPHARATVRYLRVSPYKVRQVLAQIRGLPVDDAVRLLQLSQRDAAEHVLKLLDSAVANAEHNHQLPVDELYVALAFADEGPTRKWGQPRARGRYFRVRKRSSHVTIVVARYSDDELELRRRRDEASGGGQRAQAQRRRAERVRRSRAAARGEHDHEHDHDHDEAAAEATDEAESTEAEASAAEAAEVESTDTDATGTSAGDEAPEADAGDEPDGDEPEGKE